MTKNLNPAPVFRETEKVIPLIGEMSQSDKRVYKAVEQSETEGSKEK